jgi:hypothetical protein
VSRNGNRYASGVNTVHPNDNRFRNLRAGVFSRDRYTCHVCQHPVPPHLQSVSLCGLGLDHDPVPLSELAFQVPPVSPFDVSNLKAAHSKPCPVCSAASEAAGNGPLKAGCNTYKGSGSAMRCRQLLADRCQVTIAGTAPSGRRRVSAPLHLDRPATGEREWL